jgi:hypothetical protein
LSNPLLNRFAFQAITQYITARPAAVVDQCDSKVHLALLSGMRATQGGRDECTKQDPFAV